jgi:UDP-N-acetyl-2-amino-2-deoxyglucuronate dehydrogenase
MPAAAARHARAIQVRGSPIHPVPRHDVGMDELSGARPHGFGIVGSGVIAKIHAEAIAMLPRARLVAVTDAAPESARSLADAFGCATEPDLDALLARDDVDVVSVCVPSGLHADVGAAAAAAGKHLAVEKPIEVSPAAADRLIGAAAEAGVAVTVISQHRFDRGLIELRRLLDRGALGRLVLGEASTKWYRAQGYYDSAPWRGTWSLDGGSLMNQGIHYVDLLVWCLGPVAEVTALCATQTHQIEVEDTALAALRFSSGAVGTIVSSTAVFPGFAQRLEITGTAGTVTVEDGQIVRRALRDGPGEPGPDAGRDAGPAGAAAKPADLDPASHAAQIDDLLAAIDAGRRPSVTAEDGRAALQVVCAVYESAREGRTVVIPGDPAAAAQDRDPAGRG